MQTSEHFLRVDARGWEGLTLQGTLTGAGSLGKMQILGPPTPAPELTLHLTWRECHLHVGQAPCGNYQLGGKDAELRAGMA
jgi:hypothetical protein